MNAKQTKEKTIKVIESLVTPQYEKVIRLIEMGALNGNFYTYVDFYLYVDVIKKLKTDGFKIKTGWGKFKDYKISWK
jgi:hypothetical protein